MGKNNFKNCEEIIKKFKKGDEVGYMTLSNLIKMNIGSDPRTVFSSLRVMVDCKLIKDIGNCHFRILWNLKDVENVEKNFMDLKEILTVLEILSVIF